jgi:hypothetical protein
MTVVATEHFAKALMIGEFELAYDLLTDALKTQYTPALLQQTYQNMVGYFLTPPSEISMQLLHNQVDTSPHGACAMRYFGRLIS